MDKIDVLYSSFRDPSGFVFRQEGLLYRQINLSYAEEYEQLMISGLYQELIKGRLLIPHTEESLNIQDTLAYKTIKPEHIRFISYPYEWSFSQLKDAALLTLKIQKIAIEYNMSLKDASAFNIQFESGNPIFIDTLSFEKYSEGEPWGAYKQFCTHFLAPLALMSLTNIQLGQMSKLFLDGIPLELTSRLLPWRTRFDFALFSHIHLHAKAQKHYEDKQINAKNTARISKIRLLALIDSLESKIRKLSWKASGTEWAEYYDNTNYTDAATENKKALVSKYLDSHDPKVVWDIGANAGVFSRLASSKGAFVISFDIDPAAVEKNYLATKKTKDNVLPLMLDVTNPTPSIGWENKERDSIIKRGPADTVLALALIHHLAISNNLPFNKIASFFSTICKFLIIEFVLKSDSQVQRLLASRKDIFDKYTQDNFEAEFSQLFKIIEVNKIGSSKRILYLMERR